jgi:hypothetical protein
MLRMSQVITPDKFKVDKSKISLYFDKFQYRLSLHISNIHYFRSIKNNSDYHAKLASLREDWSSDKGGHDGYVFRSDLKRAFENLIDHLPSIEAYSRWREIMNVSTEFMVRVQHDKLDVYSNKMSVFQSLLDELDSFDLIDAKFLKSKPMKNFEKGVIYQTNPKHKFRVYLSNKQWNCSEVISLQKYLIKNSFVMSPGLSKWIGENNTLALGAKHQWGRGAIYTWSNYSFDFDDESLITLLCLQHDEWVGKVCRIEKKINT